MPNEPATLPTGIPRRFTTNETAEMLRISTARVYDLIRSGDLVADRLGHSYMITLDSIKALLAESQTIPRRREVKVNYGRRRRPVSSPKL